MKTFIISILITSLCILPSFCQAAECGDVNGDGKVLSTDAIIVLKEAAGIDTGKCVVEGGTGVVSNALAFENNVLCGFDGSATMRWSEHPTMRWADDAWIPNADEGLKTVNDPYLGGRIDFTINNCGSFYIDYDSISFGYGARYSLPTNNGKIAISLNYNEYEDSIYMFIALFKEYCESTADCSAKSIIGDQEETRELSFKLNKIEE